MPLPPIPAAHLTGPPDPGKKFRLMERVRVAMARQRLRPRTIEVYVGWIRRYVQFHGRRHPADLGDVEVRDFLSDLVVDKGVAASTQNQALAALKFLYGVVLRQPLGGTMEIVPATRPRRLPIVLSTAEVRAILGRLRDPERLVVSLLYGSGLRILECVSLRVKDIDLDRRIITVRGGKGDKDRCVPLAVSAVRDVRRQLRAAYRAWREDGRWGVRVTGIDGANAVKMPNADREWSWFSIPCDADVCCGLGGKTAASSA